MSERDPFESLRDLIDQPAAPDARFADDLKSRLMSGLAESERNHSWEEEKQPTSGKQRFFVNDRVRGESVVVGPLADGTLVGIDPGQFPPNE